MKPERKELIDKFQKFFDAEPCKNIMAAICANIAEEYASSRPVGEEVIERIVYEAWKTCTDRIEIAMNMEPKGMLFFEHEPKQWLLDFKSQHPELFTQEKREIEPICLELSNNLKEFTKSIRESNLPLCHKATLCANTPGGCKCPDNVICPIQ